MVPSPWPRRFRAVAPVRQTAFGLGNWAKEHPEVAIGPQPVGGRDGVNLKLGSGELIAEDLQG